MAGENEMFEIGNKVEVLEDPAGKLSFSDVSSPEWQNRFIPQKPSILFWDIRNRYFG
jgi:hypothetical protein